MRKILTALAVAASLVGGSTVATNADAQPRYWGGHNHCWYGNGWHGAGWYWCGYAQRRGYGWGGGAGWNGWGAPGVVVRVPGLSIGVGAPVVARPGYWGGRHYCWYGNGWKGAGWYWCGYNARRGYGWGGPRGWNHW